MEIDRVDYATPAGPEVIRGDTGYCGPPQRYLAVGVIAGGSFNINQAAAIQIDPIGIERPLGDRITHQDAWIEGG